MTTASERNWPLLKSLGAEACFDYKDPDCAKKIREYTNDSLTVALDCISEGDSPKITEQAVSSKGGTITYLLKSAHDIQTRNDVERKHTSGYQVFGEAFHKLGQDVPANPEHFEHTKKFWTLTEKLVREEKSGTQRRREAKRSSLGAGVGLSLPKVDHEAPKDEKEMVKEKEKDEKEKEQDKENDVPIPTPASTSAAPVQEVSDSDVRAREGLHLVIQLRCGE